MDDSSQEATLADIAGHLERLERPFALVGGLAVSVRAEVRFTKDIDLAVVVDDDGDFEQLVFGPRGSGYTAVTLVEHKERRRLATVRLESPAGIIVDLIGSTCGIEREVVERATSIALPEVGELRVARAEELLAMKILSMSERRGQDRIDAVNLLLFNEELDVEAVRDNVRRIMERGFHRGDQLLDKLESILQEAARQR